MSNEELKQSPNTIEDLIGTADQLKYVGEFLLQSQISGMEAEKHFLAVKLINDMFVQVDSDIRNHPDFAVLMAQKEANRKAQIQAQRDLAAAQPKVADVQFG